MTAIPTTEAAALAGMSADAFRREMFRLRARGVDLRVPGPDARTPLWDGAALGVWLANRRKQ